MFRRWVLPVLLILAAGILGAWAVARRAADPLEALRRSAENARNLPPPPQVPKAPEREPPFLVLFGGEMEGRLWIPPCSRFRQGGFSRIGPIVREMAGQAPVSMILDLGDMAGGPGKSGAAELFAGLSSFNDLGLAVEAVGEKDLLVGLERWKAVRSQAASQVAVLCANLRDDAGQPLVPAAAPMTAGRKKVVVAAILSPSFEKELRDAGILVRIPDPVPALREALRNAGKADYVILLSHADPDETREILKAVPEVDVAMASHAGPRPWRGPEMVDGRVLIAGGSGWRWVNTVVLEDQGEGKRPKLGGNFSRSVREDTQPEMGIKMRTDFALQRMREPGVFEASLREMADGRPATDPLYAGPEACASCHPAAHGKWKEDPHAKSMATVRERGFDIAWNCVSCHATAPGRRGGHLAPGDAQSSVTCEACHGPGGAHVAAEGRAPLEPAKASCARCHVPEMSPAFSFDEAWPKVVHGR